MSGGIYAFTAPAIPLQQLDTPFLSSSRLRRALSGQSWPESNCAIQPIPTKIFTSWEPQMKRQTTFLCFAKSSVNIFFLENCEMFGRDATGGRQFIHG